MKPLRVFYVWSPKYELFHHILQSSFNNSPHFQLKDVFVPQSVFDKQSYKTGASHFLDGNSVKYTILVNILEKHPEETILFVDADTIIEKPTQLREYLESYMEYDVVYARSTLQNETDYSIGFGLIRSTPATIDFFKHVIHQVEQTGKDEMTVLNECIPFFSGTRRMFTFPEIIQTQHYKQYKDKYLVLQITCSNHSNYETNLFEKLVSIGTLMDITDLIPLIPDNVLQAVLAFYETHHPNHYLLNHFAKTSENESHA
jgi:hypothetical protein